MANRLTDNEKWKRAWFRKLTPTEKCFWQYLIDNCNYAGIWEVDFETAEYFIGSKIEIKEIKQTFKKQFIEFDEGKRWYILDFIEFQCKCSIDQLNPKNKFHQSVINQLEKYQIYVLIGGKEVPYKPLISPLQGIKEKDKDKEKDKEEDMDKEERRYFDSHFHQMLPPEFINTWRKYVDHQIEAGIKIHQHNVISHLKAFKECYTNGISPPELLEAFQQSSNKGLYYISKNLIEAKNGTHKQRINEGKGSIDFKKYERLAAKEPIV